MITTTLTLSPWGIIFAVIALMIGILIALDIDPACNISSLIFMVALAGCVVMAYVLGVGLDIVHAMNFGG